jgi:hypothetical protein
VHVLPQTTCCSDPELWVVLLQQQILDIDSMSKNSSHFPEIEMVMRRAHPNHKAAHLIEFGFIVLIQGK